MTVKELIEKLKEMPEDCIVTVRGYEGGVDEIDTVSQPDTLELNVHGSWYYGKHEYVMPNDTPSNGSKVVKAVHIA